MAEPQQDRSRATRRRLLESAVICLATKGWSASTVAVVAEHAGVSRGAAQHHFPTRESLFIAAVEYVAENRAVEMNELAESAGSSRLDTRAVVDLVVDLYSGDLFRAALVLWVASASEPQLRAQVVPLEARIGRAMHELTARLLGVGDQSQGTREMVQATLDLARGFGLANLLTDDSRRREPIVAQWSRTLEAFITPRREQVESQN